MGEAVTTTNPSVVCSWADQSPTSFTPGQSNGALDGVTEVTIIAAPSAGLQRMIKTINIANIDTVEHTITVQFDDNGTERILLDAAPIGVGQTLFWSASTGWLTQLESGVFQPIDADLTNIAALSGTGMLARTAADMWALRTIQAGSSIGVTNGDGVAADPSIAVTNANLVAAAALTGAADRVPVFTGLGAMALQRFMEENPTTYTPTAFFATNGDFDPTYITQFGDYWRIGDWVYFNCHIKMTTNAYTTPAGNFRIDLPVAARASSSSFWVLNCPFLTNTTFDASVASFVAFAIASQTYFEIYQMVSAANTIVMDKDNITASTSNISIRVAGLYPV